MSKKYNHHVIEKKWQAIWKERRSFKAEIDLSKPKYYVLDMFPYPSGSGLHVGHVVGYTGTDVLARFKRQKGFNVLHPMGWDSFGLPAEQYAREKGLSPKVTTAENSATYKRQLEMLGFSYDWDREIATSDPKYYKWTQWIFTKLVEKGLAYEADIPVNWCEALGTVLANEEVIDGKSERGGHPVERRPMRQWYLKITSYAERLLKDLDLTDWPESIRKAQTNWIGKSVGARIVFKEEKEKIDLPVFTTCAHTLFGVTFITLAPEHPAVLKITTEEKRESVQKYLKEVSAKSDLERTELAKDKTGVFTGAYALSPTGARVPIWVADYVLMNYGTGAVMGVAAHDLRDADFAKKYNIPIIQVIDDKDILINSENFNGLTIDEGKARITKWLEEKGLGKEEVTYKLRDWIFSRQRYWGEPIPVAHFNNQTLKCLAPDELPLLLPEVTDYTPAKDGSSPLSKVQKWVEYTDPVTGEKGLLETNTMPGSAGSSWYYLRFCDPQNDEEPWNREAEKYWMPVDLYVGGAEHAVGHLLYSRFWHKVFYDCNLVSTPEPFQCLKNQGLVTMGGRKMSKSLGNVVTPDEMIDEVGADALRLYEMFMTPFDKDKPWVSDAAIGCRRFLDRIFALAQAQEELSLEESEESRRLVAKLIDGIEKDYELMHFNTAIAKMMEFLNAFSALKEKPKSALKVLIQVLNPLAPHITEELWELLGEKESLVFTLFPKADPRYLVEDKVTVVVQVNGKMRGSFEVEKGTEQNDLILAVKENPQVAKHITGDIVKVIFVKDKIINLVVKS